MSDTEVRDRLGLTISAYRRNSEVAWDEDLRLADHLLEHGWRPPARTVTTVEEAEALPEGTVVMDSDGAALAERVGCLWWYADPYGPGSLALPATVIYEPKEG